MPQVVAFQNDLRQGAVLTVVSLEVFESYCPLVSWIFVVANRCQQVASSELLSFPLRYLLLLFFTMWLVPCPSKIAFVKCVIVAAS